MQWKEASDAFKKSFSEIAPKYNIPVTQEFEDAVLSIVWSKNERNRLSGGMLPEFKLEDAARMFSDQFGFTNPETLEKIINANPKNREAYEQKVIADYLKKKSAGPTVVSSSQGQVVEKTTDTEHSPFDADAYRKDPEGYMLARVEKIFQEKDLKVK